MTSIEFEPVAAAEAMASIAESADSYIAQGANLPPELLHNAIVQIRESHRWLDGRMHQFKIQMPTSDRKAILYADGAGTPITPRVLAEVLRDTVIQLVQVSKLVQLRGGRNA